jgi:hypothetical protein
MTHWIFNKTKQHLSNEIHCTSRHLMTHWIFNKTKSPALAVALNAPPSFICFLPDKSRAAFTQQKPEFGCSASNTAHVSERGTAALETLTVPQLVKKFTQLMYYNSPILAPNHNH